jgi:hypothetical protein
MTRGVCQELAAGVNGQEHGISLKRPKLNNGVAHAPRSRNDTPAQDRRVQLALRLRYRGIDRIVELPLSEGVLGWLAIEVGEPLRDIIMVRLFHVD